ncbi:MAG: 50S ribosomal protein L18 [Candidatus Gracilibacteria bacterium]|jgi:large subunit ribosomal protein L18
MSIKKDSRRSRRKMRVRAKVRGDNACPRLSVFKSIKFSYAQLINDEKNETLCGSSNIKAKAKGTKMEQAKQVGIDIAKKAEEKNIKKVVFDRNGYQYHGRIKAIAEGAREGGLQF